MTYKVLVLDIDGTLTNSNKEITMKTKNALRKAQELGVKVVLASGRPTPGIVPLADELELDRFGGFVLSFNGAVVTNYQTKEVVFEISLPLSEVPLLYKSSQDYGVPIVTYKNNAIITENSDNKYVSIE